MLSRMKPLPKAIVIFGALALIFVGGKYAIDNTPLGLYFAPKPAIATQVPDKIDVPTALTTTAPGATGTVINASVSGGQTIRVKTIPWNGTSGLHYANATGLFKARGLDVVAKERVYETVRKVTTVHEHNTVIFTTHDLESAVRLADEIWVLGREADKPGATVVERIDLIAAGIAWHPDMDRNPAFWPMVQRLHNLFKTL